jgi:hypothetical protein
MYKKTTSNFTNKSHLARLAENSLSQENYNHEYNNKKSSFSYNKDSLQTFQEELDSMVRR